MLWRNSFSEGPMTKHRSMERISATVLEKALRRTPPTHYVIWTGHTYRNQNGSLRSQALSRITEVGEPVSVQTLLQRAARIDGELGFDPATVRSGLDLHQGARPAVYLLIDRKASGDYVAARDIPFAGSPSRAIREGDVVLDRSGRMLANCLKAS